MHNINEKRARLQNSFAMLKLNMSSPKYLSWKHCKMTMSASDNRYKKDDIQSASDVSFMDDVQMIHSCSKTGDMPD